MKPIDSEWDASQHLRQYVKTLSQTATQSPESPALRSLLRSIQDIALQLKKIYIHENNFLNFFLLISTLNPARIALQQLLNNTLHTEPKTAILHLLSETECFLKTRCFHILDDPEPYILHGYQLFNPDGTLLYIYNSITGQAEIPDRKTAEKAEKELKQKLAAADTSNTPSILTYDTPVTLPPELNTPIAHIIWQKAIASGFITQNYQWNQPYRQKRAYFAYNFSESLQLPHRWAPFNTLWKSHRIAKDYDKLRDEFHPDPITKFPDIDEFFATLPAIAQPRSGIKKK